MIPESVQSEPAVLFSFAMTEMLPLFSQFSMLCPLPPKIPDIPPTQVLVVTGAL